MNIPTSTQALAREIARASDKVSEIFSTHLVDNDGEILPHVLFGDYARYAADLARDTPIPAAAQQELSVILGILESWFSAGDHDVVEMISVSFLEAVENTNVTKYLGPELQSEMLRILSGRDAYHR